MCHGFFFFLDSWFPHRFGSGDHARPWFCPKPIRFPFCTWFPHRLESEDHARSWFCPKLMMIFYVLGFPIGLSPRTMQGLGSVQNLYFFLCTWFPHRLESVDHARPWFCPKLMMIFYVLGFPIGLSPRTMQGLGSVQNLYFFLCTWFLDHQPLHQGGESWLEAGSP